MVEALRVVRLGEIPYQRAWDLQKCLHNARVEGQCGDHLLLLSHPHVLTVGTRGGKPDRWANLRLDQHALEARGVELIESDRGGDITYHGPGQLVAYPIVDLEGYGKDVGHYVAMLEATVLKSLSTLGIRAERNQGYPGVWIGPQKIAAIGARIRRWVTMHGFALNMRGPLEGFDWILPCGLEGRSITSIERQLPCPAPDDDAILSLIAASASAVFDRAIVEVPASQLLDLYG